MFTNKFIKNYQLLEKKLREIAQAGDNVKFSDVIVSASNKNKYLEKKKNILFDLYALRNVLSHQDRGRYIAEVNDLASKEIEIILSILKTPPLAGDVFKKEVFTSLLSDNTDYIIHQMHKHIYTHVPVYGNNKKYIGTFSETSLLDWLDDHIDNGSADFRKVQMKDINPKYLNSDINQVKFVSADTNVFDIEKMFDEAIRKKYRLGAIFITKNGRKHGELPIGIVTAWDLAKIYEYI